MLYEDYTKHRDKKRLQQFRQRNHKWSQAEKYSPSWLLGIFYGMNDGNVGHVGRRT